MKHEKDNGWRGSFARDDGNGARWLRRVLKVLGLSNV